jgi:hypothetical protein
MNEGKVSAWAERFWRRVGRSEPFPRSLETSVSWGFPLAIFKLPRLGVGSLHRWLADKDIAFPCDLADRPLRACLLASSGWGIVVIEGGDPDDERRYSLAHEVAHFLHDYLEPREKALAALGNGVREALDGLRPPSIEERLEGIFKGVEVGFYTHFMDRTVAGAVKTIKALEAEDRADRLALELLAPRREVLERMKKSGVSWQDEAIIPLSREILREEFGLPAVAADSYGRFLVAGRRSSCSIQEWLEA